MLRKIILIALLLIIIAIPVAMILISCTGENAFLKVKESSFCASLPSDSYSIICEVTAHFGTTPEAVRITTKLASLAGVDQWYTAEAADSFFAALQERFSTFESNGVTWEAFGAYVLSQYALLPPKAQAAVVIAKDLLEFNPPSLAGRPLSSFDWKRINGNISEQRLLLAGLKKG